MVDHVALTLAVFVRDTVSIHALPPAGLVRLGRSPDNHIQLQDPTVSRWHAVLHIGQQIRLECVSKTNKVHVYTGHRSADITEQKRAWREVSEPIELMLGDMILMGTTHIEIRRGAVLPCLIDDCANTLVPDDPPSGAVSRRVVMPAGIQKTLEEARLLASCSLNVTIVGPPGIGKKTLARVMHRASRRASRPFFVLACNELSETFLENELFGHEHGVFPESVLPRLGVFECAKGGTVFLNNVHALSPALQGRLQFALHDRKVFRMGGGTPRAIDVRVIAGATRDLAIDVANGTFRADLFQSLGASIALSPLCERTGDIRPLAEGFIAEACRQAGRALVPVLSAEAEAVLVRHDWPSNLTELRNVINLAVALCAGDTLCACHLRMPHHQEITMLSAQASIRAMAQTTFKAVFTATIELGLAREEMLNNIERTFRETLRTLPNPAEQIDSDLTEIDRIGWLDDGTVPVLIWLANAARAAKTRPQELVFEAAYNEVTTLLTGVRLGDDTLKTVRDAALDAGLDRDLLLKEVGWTGARNIATQSTPAGQILADLQALSTAGIADDTMLVQAWLSEASRLVGLRPQRRVFEAASEALRAAMPDRSPEPPTMSTPMKQAPPPETSAPSKLRSGPRDASNDGSVRPS